MKKGTKRFWPYILALVILLPIISVSIMNLFVDKEGGGDILVRYDYNKYSDKTNWSVIGASSIQYWDPSGAIDGTYDDSHGWYSGPEADGTKGAYLSIDLGESKEISYFEIKQRGITDDNYDPTIGQFELYVSDTKPTYSDYTGIPDTSSGEPVYSPITPLLETKVASDAFYASGWEDIKDGWQPRHSFEKQIYRFDTPAQGRYVTIRALTSSRMDKYCKNVCVTELDFGYRSAVYVNPSTFTTTQYYVDSVNGSDSNDGLSQSTAWKTFLNINPKFDGFNNIIPGSGVIFQPGDKLLLKAGSEWVDNKGLILRGSGVEGYPVSVDMYDPDNTGIKPKLDATGGWAAVNLAGAYWEVNNLDLANKDPNNHTDPLSNLNPTSGNRNGIVVTTDGEGEYRHIYLRNLDIHDVHCQDAGARGFGGISLGGGATKEQAASNDPSWFNDVLIEGCTIKNVGRVGITVGGGWVNRLKSDYNWQSWWEEVSWGSGHYKPNLNVLIRNNHLEDINGDGIFITTCYKPVIEYNTVVRSNKRSKEPNAGIWPHNCTDTLVQYNVAYETEYGHGDGQGFDDDLNCIGSIFQYNYSYNNEGGFMLLMGNSKDTIVRYNISQNDDRKTGLFDNRSHTANIYNNTFYMNGKIDRSYWGGGATTYMNNIFYAKKTGTIAKWGNYKFRNNAYYNFSNLPNDANAITEEPRLSGVGTGGSRREEVTGYQLNSDSKLINAAVKMPNNAVKDYLGNTLDDVNDIGAIDTITSGEPVSPLYYDKN